MKESDPHGSPNLRWYWAALAFGIAALFWYAGSSCTTGPYDAHPCSDAFDKRAGVAALIGIIGFFMIPALQQAGREKEKLLRAQQTAPPDELDQLDKLNSLREKGAISEEEFERKKAELLASG